MAALTAPLSSTKRERLAKVLARLGSDHAGERAAAGLLADQLLREAGLSWRDLVAPARAPTADHREAAALVLAGSLPLTAWERRFLDGVTRQPGVTLRQERVLLHLCRRAGVPYLPFDP